jgi:hypothetical protein
MRLPGTFTLVCFTAIMLAAGSAYAQKELIDRVTQVIKAGNAKDMTPHLQDQVDVTVDGKMESYSKAQTEFVLRDFFKKYPPSSFSIVHQGSSKGGLHFAIGQYASGKDNFQVWIRMKSSNDVFLIHELSFIKQ